MTKTKRIRYRQRNKVVRWINERVTPTLRLDSKIIGEAEADKNLYVSENGWRTLKVLYTFDVSPSCLFLSEAGTLFVCAGNVVKRSDDGGESWTDVLTMGSGDTLRNGCLTEGPTGTLYAATYGNKSPSNGKVYKSTDDGETWSLVYDFVDDEVLPSTGAHIHCCHYDPHTGDVWVAIGDTPNSSIFKSGDGGASWIPVSHPTLNPREIDGHPGKIYHQPVVIWADTDAVYFGPDNAPYGVLKYDKQDDEFSLAVDFIEDGTSGHTLAMRVVGGYLYAASKPHDEKHPSYLYRMDPTTKVWSRVWDGYLLPAAGTHGILSIAEASPTTGMLVYAWGGKRRIGEFSV